MKLSRDDFCFGYVNASLTLRIWGDGAVYETPDQNDTITRTDSCVVLRRLVLDHNDSHQWNPNTKRVDATFL